LKSSIDSGHSVLPFASGLRPRAATTPQAHTRIAIGNPMASCGTSVGKRIQKHVKGSSLADDEFLEEECEYRPAYFGSCLEAGVELALP